MSTDEDSSRLRVAVVGPCTSGKSTLTAALLALGYDARQPAQEHSYVLDMWQRLVKPDVLVYLDVSYDAARQRRRISWGQERLDKQAGRLAHARQHANLYIDTSPLTADEVRAQVIGFLTDLPAG